MHDDLLERRLRAALQAEGDSLPFTITPEELRRRLEIRRRGRIGRPGMLLLAAAIGVGLVGIGALAGGWLDRRDTIIPSPLPSAPIAVVPTPAPSSLVLPPSVPPMEVFLAGVDPARIVRAQAVGLSTGPTSWSLGIGGPASTTFAPVSAAGTYQVLLACVGAPLAVTSVPANSTAEAGTVRVTCDGTTGTHDLQLAAGDAVSIEAPDPTSWRFALLAPERAAPHAAGIASAAAVAAAAGPRHDSEAASALTAPDYAAVAPVNPIDQPGLSLSVRDAFRIATSCAGPGPITFLIQSPPSGVSDPVEPAGAALRSSRLTVECDGAIHVDVVRFPYAIGADVRIDAPAGTAWRIAASFEDPPIAAPKDGDGWKAGFGIGPNLLLRSEPDLSTLTFENPVRARIVVTCRGGDSVDVLVHDRDSGVDTPFTAPCQAGRATVSVGPSLGPVRSMDLSITTRGPMWLIVSIQQAAGG